MLRCTVAWPIAMHAPLGVRSPGAGWEAILACTRVSPIAHIVLGSPRKTHTSLPQPRVASILSRGLNFSSQEFPALSWCCFNFWGTLLAPINSMALWAASATTSRVSGNRIGVATALHRVDVVNDRPFAALPLREGALLASQEPPADLHNSMHLKQPRFDTYSRRLLQRSQPR